MRVLSTALLLPMLLSGIISAQFAQDFSGTWKLSAARSELGGLSGAADEFLRVEQKGAQLTAYSGPGEQGPFRTMAYALDGGETRVRQDGRQISTRVKWEGAALLTNSLVSGAQNYTIMERWRCSRDGSTLTIKRTIVRMNGEREGLLVYERAGQTVTVPADEPPTAPRPPATPELAPQPAVYTVDQGTRIPLSLINPLNTKTAAPGDRVYFRTVYPILDQGRIVIPPGSYVTATITSGERAGRVKGRAALHIRVDSLTLSNGTTRDLRSRVGTAETKVDGEGTLQGDTNKAGDTRTVGETTAAGAGVGAIAGNVAGHGAMGAGLGAAAGAAGGLIGVLARRGPDVMLPKGASFEMVLDRALQFTAEETRGGRR
jgi:type IV secretion system protein VirB10